MSFFGDDLEDGFYEYMLIDEDSCLFYNEQIKKGVFEMEEVKKGYNGDGINFCEAFEFLRAGHRIARRGWKEKGSFLWYKPPQKVTVEICNDPVLKEIAESNGGVIAAVGVICIYTRDIADRKIVKPGWTPDAVDLIVNDWVVL